MIKQANQIVKVAASENINLITLAKGIIVSYIITVPAFIMFAFILTYTSFPEKLIWPVVVITSIISLLTAGSTVTRNLKSRGWLNGGLTGLVYMLVLYLVSSVVYRNFAVDRYVISMVLVGVLVGAIGGIIGINLKRGSRSRRQR